MRPDSEYRSLAAMLSERITCNRDERGTAFEAAKKIVALSCEVRKNGLLWLEQAPEGEQDIFLLSCLRYIADGEIDPDEFREFTSIWLLTAEESGGRLLEMAVLADGLEQILRNRGPRLLWRRLGAWLGVEFSDKVEAAIAELEQQNLEQYWEKRMKETVSVHPEFDRLIDLPDEAFSNLIRTTDRALLTLALMGAGREILGRAAELEPKRWTELKQEFGQMAYPRPGDVLEAQRQILTVL